MRLHLVIAASLLSASLAAHADVIQDFNFTGTFDNASTVSGTFTVDITSGVLLGTDALYLGQNYDVITYAGPDTTLNAFVDFQSQSGSVYPVLILGLAGSPSLIGYSGGLLCSEANTCNGIGSAYATGPGNFTTYLAYGSVTPGVLVTPTPEPSSLALLGTGILGAIGVARRRLA